MAPAERTITFYWSLMHCGLPLTATVAQGRNKAQFSGQKLHLLGDIRIGGKQVFLFVCMCVFFFFQTVQTVLWKTISHRLKPIWSHILQKILAVFMFIGYNLVSTTY